MSTTAERLFYPVERLKATTDNIEMDTRILAMGIADELKAENLVLASREDIRLAVEVAISADYAELGIAPNDEMRKSIDSLSSSIFTELERSA